MKLKMRCRECGEVFEAEMKKAQIQELVLSEGFTLVCPACVSAGAVKDLPEEIIKTGYLVELWIHEEDLN